jgi:hypothetical protein
MLLYSQNSEKEIQKNGLNGLNKILFLYFNIWKFNVNFISYFVK